MALAQEFLNIAPEWIQQNPNLAEMWVTAYIGAGGAGNDQYAGSAATSAVRGSNEYRQIFPSMFDDEGNMRFVSDPEATYQRTIESYRNTLRSLNLNPEVFEGRLHSLIEGAVSPNEFVQRTEAIYENIIESSPYIRDWYAENYGLELSDQAILASVIDGPDGPVSGAILEDRITTAQIAGEGEQRGFNITSGFADLLEDTGMTRQGAQQFFGQAASLIPALSVLAARNADPDDDFSLDEFAQAEVFNDPEQRRRIRRLRAQEQSTFTGGAGIELARDRSGGVAGLVER